MKIKYLFIIFLYLCLLQAYSQNVNVQDPAAEVYLNSLSVLFDPQKAFQIEFRYEVENHVEGTKVSDYGSVIMKGNSYKLKLEDGEMCFNGEKVWVYNKEAAEVYVSIPDKNNSEQMLLDPFRLLSKYKEYYKYRLKGEFNLDQNTYVNIELYPKNLETSYSILRLILDKKTHELYSFEMQQKNGVIYKITVTEKITQIKVNDSIFIWNSADYPGVLEVEM
jgi:outer membrane lipoprotein-sorting protein